MLPQVDTGGVSITSAWQLLLAASTIGPGQLMDSGAAMDCFWEWEPAWLEMKVGSKLLLHKGKVADPITMVLTNVRTIRELNFMANFLFDEKMVTVFGNETPNKIYCYYT